jgi:hypothetical protein
MKGVFDVNIDQINDIEILKTELKKRMVECIKTYEKDGEIFHKGEYYDFYQDNYDDFRVIGEKSDVEIDVNYFKLQRRVINGIV